jgi:hypothetical protein
MWYYRVWLTWKTGLTLERWQSWKMCENGIWKWKIGLGKKSMTMLKLATFMIETCMYSMDEMKWSRWFNVNMVDDICDKECDILIRNDISDFCLGWIFFRDKEMRKKCVRIVKLITFMKSSWISICIWNHSIIVYLTLIDPSVIVLVVN